ncbi:MAG: hypothetical protein HY905_01575 [Deltaproteobacteria bacterium]|nr:hypothetical protein [Deltaproteobacteria bacterium]
MGILAEFGLLARRLAERIAVPRIRELFLPPWPPGVPAVEHEFLVMLLEGGAAGLSYVLLPPQSADDYRALDVRAHAGARPEPYVEAMGRGDPVADLLGLAAVNAICQHVMRSGKVRLDHATDSLGLLAIEDGDRVGMVGLFPPLLRLADPGRFELVIVEKDASLIEKHPGLKITLDVTALRRCNKVVCTSATVLNETIDEVLANCGAAKHVSVVGPTAGFLPDPLFARGVHVVGGRYVVDAEKLLARVKSGDRWGDATERTCFEKTTYVSPLVEP